VSYIPVGVASPLEFQRLVAAALNPLLQGLFPVNSTTSSITIAAETKLQLVDATSGPVTITLPTALEATNRVLTVKKVDATANAVTIDGSGTETIDGAATRSITAQWDSMTIVSNGTTWYRI